MSAIVDEARRAESVSGNIDYWAENCTRAAQDDAFFEHFRSDRAFLQVVEGTPETGAIWNLKRLLKNPLFTTALPLIRRSDYVGTPRCVVLFTDPCAIEDRCALSPTTIRYANNAANCIALFGAQILTECPIYEIGAGYGGECKVFNDFAVTMTGKPIARYTCFDLPSSYGLIRRFLEHFDYSANIGELTGFTPLQPALVMSNGALSEMHGDLLESYVHQVVRPAKFGYFITNFETHSKPFGGWSTDDFLRVLREMGKDARELHTESYISYFDKQAGSRLIVFGTEAPERSDLYSSVDVLKIWMLQKAYGVIRRLTADMVNPG